ncbi:MAG: hypothetical protein GEV13_21450 [Rhodospirillales bacterium]|nr:hypothetical protein [Rhodospirillales bacterium]
MALPANQQTVSRQSRQIALTGLSLGNIITIPVMHEPVSPGTALLAMSASARIAAALGVSALLWLAAWWAL